MTKRLKISVVLLGAILLIVPATVSISQTAEMERTNTTSSVRLTPDNDNSISKLAAGTTILPIGKANQTPATMIMIGIGLIATAGMARKKIEKSIPLNRSTTDNNYQPNYDRPVLSR